MNRRQFINQSNAVVAAVALGAGTAATAATPKSQSTKEKLEMNSPHLYERLTRDNAVLLLVDHQVGLYSGVRDIETLELKHNVVGLAKAALALKVPVIVTTTTENMWGPLIPELAGALPGVKRIERTTVNAWDERRVVDAVKATGRKKLIVAGVSTDVCLAFPAISAIADGYSSYAVIDASGGFSKTQVEMGVARMQQAGVIPVGYSNVAVEILGDNAAPDAEAVYAALGIPFAGLVYGLKQYFSRN
ncbi:isochorismatase family protein [Herbaspirillum chlorophenolicum]|uniref:isochorismatase family protein n=1 Tax=Herbaspirillum chlorophenolicum TaxID=211589 RepID=UPI00067A764E|nr:isochorismatase family protein [Herbaspirillum chlorophenolicum]